MLTTISLCGKNAEKKFLAKIAEIFAFFESYTTYVRHAYINKMMQRKKKLS